MLGAPGGEVLDQSRLGSVEPAQKLVQRAQHLARELGRDGGLGVAAGLQEGAQALVGRGVEQTKAAERQLQAGEHRPAGDGRERAQREGEPAGGLALRGVDQAQLVVADQHADEHAGLAQQPLEALMRARLPAIGLTAAIGIDAAGLEANQKLPGRIVAEALDRPVGLQRGVVLRDRKSEIVGQCGPARRAGDEARDSSQGSPRTSATARRAPARLHHRGRRQRRRCRPRSGARGPSRAP